MSLAPVRPPEFEVIADVAQLCREGHTVSGVICVSDGTRYFPERGWNDAIVRVLTAWCRTSATAISGGRGAYEFLFQDGAFGWEAHIQDSGCRIELFQWGDKRQTVAETAADFKKVSGQLLREGRRVWNACQRFGWLDQHVTALEMAWRGLAELHKKDG